MGDISSDDSDDTAVFVPSSGMGTTLPPSANIKHLPQEISSWFSSKDKGNGKNKQSLPKQKPEQLKQYQQNQEQKQPGTFMQSLPTNGKEPTHHPDLARNNSHVQSSSKLH